MTIRTMVALLGLLGCGLALAADPPALVNYQGVLRDSAGKPVPDGPYSMVFRFYAAPGPGGDAILLDSQTVTVTGGLFNVQLGKNAADGPGPGRYVSLAQVFADHAALYLEVQVGSETLAPRVPFASAGYALNARKLRGVEVTSAGPLTLYVIGSTGDDANDGLTPGTAKKTIQGAVDAIPPVLRGDVTVRIADGTYHERIVIMAHTRTGLYWIRLIGNTAFPELVVVDGGNPLPPPESVDSGILVLDLPVEITGISVQNFGMKGDNFGLQAAFNAYVTLQDCRFVNNSAGEAALTAADGASIDVSETVISGNSKGIASLNRGSVRLRDFVEVSGNIVQGVEAVHGSQVVFDPTFPGRCTISNNEMQPGDHSTISGYSRCSVNASPCVTDEDDPTARCEP